MIRGRECFFHVFSSPPTGHVRDAVMVADAISVRPRYGTANIIIDAMQEVTGGSAAICVLVLAFDVGGGLKFIVAVKVLQCQ